jgi:hypothetical protein
VVLNALGGAENDLAGVEIRADAGQRGAQELRGNDGDDNFGLPTAALSPVTVRSAGMGKPGRKRLVFAGVNDLLGKLGAVRPERDLVTAATVKGEGEGGSPSSGPQNNDATHADLLTPRRDSVPARRRRMFW